MRITFFLIRLEIEQNVKKNNTKQQHPKPKHKKTTRTALRSLYSARLYSEDTFSRERTHSLLPCLSSRHYTPGARYSRPSRRGKKIVGVYNTGHAPSAQHHTYRVVARSVSLSLSLCVSLSEITVPCKQTGNHSSRQRG